MSPVDAFKTFISDVILDMILEHTNHMITVRAAKYKVTSTSPVTKDKLLALIGPLIFSAVMKNNHLSSTILFDERKCGITYRPTMSRERFKFLIDSLRFDNKATRDERKVTDPFAAIRDIWDIFINICKTAYVPSTYMTIDEQLLGFRGKCPFRMYIPNRPEKYSIKIVMVCDTASKYMLNAAPYLGKKTNTEGLTLAEYFVKSTTRIVSKLNHG
nr:unnamed protein product [Callosobruchus analis]